MSFDELLHFFKLGGITLAAIVASSFLAVGVAIERVIALWGAGSTARELGRSIAKQLLRGDISGARNTAERSRAVVADVFRVGFERAAKTVGPALEAAVDRERQQVALSMRRGLWILATIGATTPFVGLFGTVAGIMRSFKDLGLDVNSGGTGGSAAVMTGISEALVATAAGILVAVLAVVLYNIFQARLGRLNVELKLISEEFVELLREQPPNGSLTTSGTTPESAVKSAG
jgi:biopolymer transport protein ExbB/TolQ